MLARHHRRCPRKICPTEDFDTLKPMFLRKRYGHRDQFHSLEDVVNVSSGIGNLGCFTHRIDFKGMIFQRSTAKFRLPLNELIHSCADICPGHSTSQQRACGARGEPQPRFQVSRHLLSHCLRLSIWVQKFDWGYTHGICQHPGIFRRPFKMYNELSDLFGSFTARAEKSSESSCACLNSSSTREHLRRTRRGDKLLSMRYSLSAKS